MTLQLMNEKALSQKLNSLVQLAKAYYFFYFSWGFFYWNAGSFTYKNRIGDCRT